MKGSIFSISVLSVGLMMLASCSTIKKAGSLIKPKSSATAAKTETPKPAEESVSVTVAESPLAGEWSITEVNGKEIVVNGENHPKLALQSEAAHPGEISVIGYNGCNYINGTWMVDGTRLTRAGEFISSLMLCQDAPYETEINVALNTATGFAVDDEQNVRLTDASGTTLLKLRKRNLSFLNGAWQVTSIEGQPVPASANIVIVIDIDECKIHGNAGCNILNGEITVNLDKGDAIEFKNLMTSRMMCPDINTEQVFLLALESVDRASSGIST
ncbi:MAG: META domain-containing protein, partial [Duncaniella sp.]|nr:META domain-containing protein [Duncaniella sp.]